MASEIETKYYTASARSTGLCRERADDEAGDERPLGRLVARKEYPLDSPLFS